MRRVEWQIKRKKQADRWSIQIVTAKVEIAARLKEERVKRSKRTEEKSKKRMGKMRMEKKEGLGEEWGRGRRGEREREENNSGW